jgi:hypothetical protein
MYFHMQLDPEQLRGVDADISRQVPTAPRSECHPLADGLFGPHTHILRSSVAGRPANDDCLPALIRDLSPRAVELLARSPLPVGEPFRLVLVPTASESPTDVRRPLVVAEYRTLRCEEPRAGAGEFAILGTLLTTTGWQGNTRVTPQQHLRPTSPTLR